MMKTLLYLTLFCLFANFTLESFGQLPGQTPIDPKSVPQFVDPLPHFAGMRVDASGGELFIRYVPSNQVAVSTGTVLANGIVGTDLGAGVGKYWTYSVSNDGINFTPPFWPSFTIEAYQGTPVNVSYENLLHGETYENVNLIVDQTLHWANPLNDATFPKTPYTGTVPVVPHLHGGEVPSESDGGPDAWFTPGFAETGPSWGIDGTDQYYYYPNTQEEATLWYHDHSLGVTRLNVYAGLAGFYFLRGTQEELAQLPGWSGDDLVQEVAPVGTSGVFNPEPYLPEIEIVFQDRMFDTNGELYFPNLPPNPNEHPFWNPEFIGDIITVNGKTWPYLSVAPRKYRFRLLNGSNARFYEMWLQDLPTKTLGPPIVQIGTDGGLLDAPVIINKKLILAPGERADIIIDFSQSAPGQIWTLKNSANTPYPKGGPPNGSTVGRLMQFIVNGEMVSATNTQNPGVDKSQIPNLLRTSPIVKLTDFAGNTNVTPILTRQLTLNEVMGFGGPLEALINNSKWDMNGINVPGLGETELPVEGTTELWQIINMTGDAHPIHLHLVQFQLVGRQAYNVNKYTNAYDASFTGGVYTPAIGPPFSYDLVNADGAVGGNPGVNNFLQGKLMPPNLNERGWKDTYIVYPGEVTTFIVRYAPTDLPIDAAPSELLFSFDPSKGPGYVWHCHILDHEDNEMMRPYKVMASTYRQGVAFKSTAIEPNNEQNLKTEEIILTEFKLAQNYPNPFTNETEIRFSLPEPTKIRLALFNQTGQLIKILMENEAPAGNNTVKLNSEGLPNGVYYYQIVAGNYKETKKLLIE